MYGTLTGVIFEKGIKRKKASYEAGFRINEAATYSPGSNPSTIGAAGLNFSVRD
ncbi:MAG: hypothetical protein ACI9UV_000970, partial [Algoriphagus sp.]